MSVEDNYRAAYQAYLDVPVTGSPAEAMVQRIELAIRLKDFEEQLDPTTARTIRAELLAGRL